MEKHQIKEKPVDERILTCPYCGRWRFNDAEYYEEYGFLTIACDKMTVEGRSNVEGIISKIKWQRENLPRYNEDGKKIFM